MTSNITVPQWQYHDQNIQGSIAQSDFTRSDRVIIYSAPTPVAGQQTVPMQAIGLIQGWTHQEQKQLQLFYELGSDAPIIVPGLTQGNISLSRILLNGLNFLNAIYHGVNTKSLRPDQILRSIRDVNIPLDLMLAKYPVLDGDPNAAAVETTLFRGCQISSLSQQVSSGGVVVMESVAISYATIPKVTFSM